MTARFQTLKHQAAGHGGTLTDFEELLVFKPSNGTEIDFYETMQTRECRAEETIDIPLERWMPTYLGRLEMGISKELANSKYNIIPPELSDNEVKSDNSDSNIKEDPQPIIVLENLLRDFKKPNILDVKLGKVLFDEFASEEKKARLTRVSESTTSGTLGFRICGMKIQFNKNVNCLKPSYYDRTDDEYVLVNKHYGRSLTERNIIEGIKLYFACSSLSGERRHHLVDIFLKRLQLFYNTLLSEEVRLISSSLLFIYEGDNERWDEDQDRDSLFREGFLSGDESDDSQDDCCSSEEEGKFKTKRSQYLSSLSLIDFAHSFIKRVKGTTKIS